MPKKQFRLLIVNDADAESPRCWDNLGTIYADHRTYNLSDKDAKDLRDEEGELPEDLFWLPIYMYDHGGITLNTTGFSCKWDSGQVGYIYVEKEKAQKEYKDVPASELEEKVLDRLRDEIKLYDTYLRGDVYGFVVKPMQSDEDGDFPVIDSCYGFYGSDPEENGMKEQLELPLDQYQVVYPWDRP